jgi:uncharacterized membrane protein YfcA
MSDLIASLSSAGAAILSQLDWLQLVLILLTIFCAATVKGAIGFGFPLLATPLISTIWDARQAVLLLSIASFLNNIQIVARGGGSRASFGRFLPVLVGVIIGTVGGALLLASVNPRLLGGIVGLAALAFGIVALVRPDLSIPPRLERYLAFPMGLAGGLLGGSTSIFAPALASYTHALHLSKREFVFFLTMLYVVGTGVQVSSYVQLGLYNATVVFLAFASLVPNLLGVSLGFRLQDRIDPKLFRRLVVLVIILTGGSLVLRNLFR